MFVIIGISVVVGSVLIGYLVAGGNLILLMQPAEYIIIGGAALGSLLIASSPKKVKKIIASVIGTLKSEHPHKEDYLEILKSFNDLFLEAQKDGLLSIEAHIENPLESKVLSRNKKFIGDPFITDFFCDSMKVLLTGSVPPHELETLIDTEIESYEMEAKPIAHAIEKLADAFPGLGIVAAVMGIIITMSSINEGAEAVGHHVAAALVGTFLGVLIAYGFVGPIASKVEHDIDNKIRYLQTIKACIVAYAKGNPPIIAVEIARRTIFSDERPGFSELEDYMRGKKRKE